MVFSSDGVISWIPLEGVLNSEIITLIVSEGVDENQLIDIETLSIVVFPVNDPPVIVSTPSLNANEDTEYIYQINIEDPDTIREKIIDTVVYIMERDKYYDLTTHNDYKKEAIDFKYARYFKKMSCTQFIRKHPNRKVV